MDKQPSFGERIELLRDAASRLEDVATILVEEVEHMEEAQKRFAGKRERNAKASR